MSKGKNDMENRGRRARQRDIADRLQRMYEQVLDEPVPDDFLRLLDEADRAGSKSSGGTSEENS
ncbi:MAG: NepR family anti-sigma factor [Hyphomonadaceae bacterium]